MKIFLTGATGFIGSHLVGELSKDHEILCLVRENSNTKFLEAAGTKYYQGDIRNKGSLHRGIKWADVVIHAAALLGIKVNRKEIYEINFLGAENILEFCKKYGKPLIHISSTSVLKNNKEFKEKFTCEYEETKYLAHREVLKYAEDIPITIVLPSGGFGPRGDNLTTKFIRDYVEGKLKAVVCPEAKVSLVYIKDLVKAIKLLVEKKATGEFIVTGYNVTIGELYDKLKQMTGVKKPKLKVGYRGAKFLGALFGQKKAVEFINNQGFFEADKIRKLGWKPIGLESALKETIESFNS